MNERESIAGRKERERRGDIYLKEIELKVNIDLQLKVLRGVRGYKTKDNELSYLLTYCDILEILKKFV